MAEDEKSAQTGGGATKPNAGAALIGLVAIGVAIWYFFGGGLEDQANRNMQQIQDKVAADAVVQYGIAKRNGSAMDICVQGIEK